MNYASNDQIDQRLPLYQRLRDELAGQIARNTWRPGELIPTEAELAKQHGIAVGTVRRAIDTLVTDGLVERQQGRGTFVRRPRFDQSLLRFFRYGRPNDEAVPRSELLSREAIAAPPDHIVESLQLQPGQSAIRISRLRSFEAPFLREEIWLPHPQFAPLLDACAEEIGDLLYPAYEQLCGAIVARAEETLTVGTADEEDASVLGIPTRAPLVIIDRFAFGFGGERLEWRRSHGATSMFRYKVDIY